MIYKCKMCGGELDISGKEHVCECSFCGVTQTIPDVDEEKTLQLYNRATFLLKSCEYDKASSVYEKIIADQGEQAEAYWGLCLCKYGIEYVDDPKTGKKIPTCHRTLINSILKDPDFIKAVDLADVVAKKIYKEEAEYIDVVQKKILEISNSEEPYDIFICYKETDKIGKRTPDSVIAENIYDALTEKGYRVFFSKISLEDKIGQEYEPYIFAALTSSKVMLVIGTKEEHFNAPWVKNEWSRFLKLCNSGEKKYLIPCYKDISPYEMPEEFVNLQSQDLGKIGFLQDLTKGIGKLFEKHSNGAKKTVQVLEDEIHVLYKELRRMLLFIKDSSQFDEKTYYEKWRTLYTLEDSSASEDNPEKAPLACACSFLHYNDLPNFQYSKPKEAFEAMWYIEEINISQLEKTDPDLAEEIKVFLNNYSNDREELEKQKKYNKAIAFKKEASKPEDYLKLYKMFFEIGDYRDAIRQAEFYKNKSNITFDATLKEYLYEKLINRISKYNTESEKLEILSGLHEISNYKDVKKYIEAAEYKDPVEIENKIENLKSKKEALISNNSEIISLQNLISDFKKELNLEIEKITKTFNEKKAYLENEIADIEKDYKTTFETLSKCGLFAFKEKKILRDKLNILETEVLKVRRENGRQINEYEIERNNKIDNIKSFYENKIIDCEKQIKQIISSIIEIKSIDEEISNNEKELLLAQENQDNLENFRKIWQPENINVFYDYDGFKILTFKLGKFPQSKVLIPSLVKDLKAITPDRKGIYHLHGLEFVLINNKFYLVEQIKWKVIKYACINGKYHYLLTTKEVLDVRSTMESNNVVTVARGPKSFDFLTKDENEPISLYKYSDIRKWLINDFYGFAFNANEKKMICTAQLDNSADSTSDEATIFSTENTEDKVFLLSYRACKNSHLGEDLYGRKESGIASMTRTKLEPIIERENSIIDNELIPSLGLDVSEVAHFEFDDERNKNRIFEDLSEFCCTDLYSDYAFELIKSKSYQKGALLRSPDTENITGYNTFREGKVYSFGGQFKKGKFDIINDVLPCIIICLDGNEDIIIRDEGFDF